MKVVFVVLGLLAPSLTYKLPEGTKRCHKSDPDLENCLKDAITDGFSRFANGYKPLGIPQLDPLHIAELSQGEGAGGIEQSYKNIDITGLKTSKVVDLKVDLENRHFDIVAETPHSEMTADYTMKGNMLGFPINSAGKCKIVFDGITTKHNVKFDRYQKDGKTYVKITDWKIDIVPKAVHYDYENLIPGNQQLSETIMKTINENAVQIYLDHAPTFNEAYSQIYKVMNNLVYDKIPEDEIYLP